MADQRNNAQTETPSIDMDVQQTYDLAEGSAGIPSIEDFDIERFSAQFINPEDADAEDTVADVTMRCPICCEDRKLSDMHKHRCNCPECTTCIKKRFLDYIKGVYPLPRCCEDLIDIFDFPSHVISEQIRLDFEEKKAELATPNPTYCFELTCQTFINPKYITPNSKATCTVCNAETCTKCKNQFHDGECVVDEELARLKEFAKAEGYQQCSRCNRMVERSEGCDHMICICGYEFCYACGEASHGYECREGEIGDYEYMYGLEEESELESMGEENGEENVEDSSDRERVL